MTNHPNHGKISDLIRAHKLAFAADLASRDRYGDLLQRAGLDFEADGEGVAFRVERTCGSDLSAELDALITARNVREKAGAAEATARAAFEALPIRTAEQLAAVVAYAKEDATAVAEGVETVEVLSLWRVIDRLAADLAAFIKLSPADPVPA